jgi:phosphoribosylformimino-5-aminoimidazole carboxamide ribotide isomerase
MRFRPCIDIHNGKVKQIVGSSLSDRENSALDNFISDRDADFFAKRYFEDGLRGGHAIILNKKGSEYYEDDINQVKKALEATPGFLQIGGGIDNENAEMFLSMGASHVIVTSFVFRDGRIDYDNLCKISSLTGPDRLVLDLSCKLSDGKYKIVTDRWQKITEEVLGIETFKRLSEYCDEFLIHAVDVEGKRQGVEKEVLHILADSFEDGLIKPVTYAGGIRSMEDIELIKKEGKEKIDFTVGSALDIFGGSLKYRDLITLSK